MDNFTNLGFLALDYACIALASGLAVIFAESRSSWGLAWAWNVPVFALAITLIGGLQHRLAGLGHEASHYVLLKNKFFNDLVGDVFCMFPILSTVHFYRLFHFAHHRYTNDRQRDPDLVNLGPGKRVDDFPMSRFKTILTVYLRVLVFPWSFVRYQLEYIELNTLGKGNNVYMRSVPHGDAHFRWPRLGTSLGIAFLLGMHAAFWTMTTTGRAGLLVPTAVIGLALGCLGAAVLPEWAVFQSPFRQPYSGRVGGMIRLAFYTSVCLALAGMRLETAGNSAIYVIILWFIPMGTTFMYFMLLRDIYQHTNADEGRLTNSRVFYCDPFTRWAVFVHGQDMHVPHHLFPAIPHYRLPSLHRLLQEKHAGYRDSVVECHGTFADDQGRTTVLDVLTASG